MTPEVKKIGNKLFDKVELASQKVDLALTDSVIKSFDSYIKNLQVVTDLQDSVKKSILDYNKKVDSIKKKFSDIEKGEYLKTYNEITKTAKDLGIAPNDVPGLVEMDKKYFAYKQFTNDLEVININ